MPLVGNTRPPLCGMEERKRGTMTEFHLIEPTLENYYRGIILFGANVASYKFALGKSLLELAGNSDDLISIEELADHFSSHVADWTCRRIVPLL